MVEPGYAWLRVSQFQDRTVDDFAQQARGAVQAGPEHQGPGARPAQRPGRPARRRGRRSRRPSCRRTSIVVTTNGQIADSKATFKASPEFYLRRGGADPLRAARGAEDGAAGGAGQRGLGLGQRDRRRRAAGPPARHHHGRADLRQGLGADGAPALARHRAEDHHRALLHAERRARSRPRASCPTSWLDETAEGNLFAALRIREADLEKHLQQRPGRRGQGRGAREGARRSAQEARGRGRQARARRRSRCPNSAAPTTSSWRRRSTA